MTPAPPDIEILLRLGTTERRVPLVAIAAVLRVQPSALRDALGRLLLGAHPIVPVVEGEPTEGEERFVSIISFRERTERSFDQVVSTKGGGAGEENTARPVNPTAEDLAAALDDWSSLGHLRLLAARYPSALLDDALRRTLAVPRDRIRKTRGAYFTGVVKALGAGCSPPPKS